jgi:hypothetical protein
VRGGGVLVFSTPPTATPGGLHHHIRDAKPALQRALLDHHVLNVLEGDGGFVDLPDAAAEPHRAVGQDVPGRVVSEVDGDIDQDVGQDGQRQHGKEEDGADEGHRDHARQPRDEDRAVEYCEDDPELKLQVAKPRVGGPERLHCRGVMMGQRRRFLGDSEPVGEDEPEAGVDLRCCLLGEGHDVSTPSTIGTLLEGIANVAEQGQSFRGLCRELMRRHSGMRGCIVGRRRGDGGVVKAAGAAHLLVEKSRSASYSRTPSMAISGVELPLAVWIETVASPIHRWMMFRETWMSWIRR